MIMMMNALMNGMKVPSLGPTTVKVFISFKLLKRVMKRLMKMNLSKLEYHST